MYLARITSRRGLGARLLTEVEARLTPLVKLTVRRSNTAAIHLYQKFGYRQVDMWDNYYSDGEAGLVMDKRRRTEDRGLLAEAPSLDHRPSVIDQGNP